MDANFFKDELVCEHCKGKIPDECYWDLAEDPSLDGECHGHLGQDGICSAFDYLWLIVR